MGRLDGKVVAVTGAARGMGRAHAVTAAREGADVMVCDIDHQPNNVAYPLANQSDLEETVRQVQELGRRAIAMTVDVRSEEQLHAWIEHGVAELGRVDVMVANAGVTGYAPAHELDQETWDLILDVNLKGAWLSAKVVIPHMLERGEGGSIIFISSGLGLKGLP